MNISDGHPFSQLHVTEVDLDKWNRRRAGKNAGFSFYTNAGLCGYRVDYV
jgi:hypothetical protein